MEGIRGLDPLGIGSRRVGPVRERDPTGGDRLVEVAVGLASGVGGGGVDSGEQAGLEDLGDLGVLGRADDRLLAGQHRLGISGGLVGGLEVLVEEALELGRLLAVGVGVGGQRDDHHHMGGRSGVLEEALEEHRDGLGLAAHVGVA